MQSPDTIIGPEDLILLTGTTGFIGTHVLRTLPEHGVRRVRCFVRPSSDLQKIEEISRECADRMHIEVCKGNLLSREDCLKATKDVTVVYHLAVGGGGRSFPDAFMNAVVTTRNLIEAVLQNACLKRFVNISSLAVYTNRDNPHCRVLDESSPIDDQPELRGEPYSYAKVRQDQLVMDYGKNRRFPYVIIRPGVVYGAGKNAITGRVGIGTFGLFLHLGGSNLVPFTHVDNCAEAIVLAGLRRGIDGEVFNIVDDDLPTSRQFLRLYKRHVRRFASVYVPRSLSYLLCYSWEKYAAWSAGQLPELLNRRAWHAYWKGSQYANEKPKRLLGWTPKLSTSEGLQRLFQSCANGGGHA